MIIAHLVELILSIKLLIKSTLKIPEQPRDNLAAAVVFFYLFAMSL